mgnify:CR=1 FL=1
MMALVRSFPAVVSVQTAQNGSFDLLFTAVRFFTFCLHLKNAKDTVVWGRANTFSWSKLTTSVLGSVIATSSCLCFCTASFPSSRFLFAGITQGIKAEKPYE